ncbi:CopY/TcrY family copper transport repressor [Paucilactobacillus wasatchensis]|uniref:Negative transcriptional regulator-copper transport operon n=1 Tax=Paucilactobacillus wasatchensis TaxID=1335616 RepID=A0A0D0YYS4_9LACO|nr:CopY/TcrY family copper transport repressor [Paucilactobacillus wasatchensis]KIS04379.1 Negative transcriptional regulator-copper transport operon [Paucilactobacillus wasatchensis]
MNPEKVSEITPSEWEVMRIIWTKGPSHSRELIDLIQRKRDWTESTIKTLLGRLVKKGLLETNKVERKFVYSTTVGELDAMNLTSQQLFDHLCAMKKGQTLVNLIVHTNLTKNDVQKLLTVLQKKEQTAPDTIACDCLPNDEDCTTDNCECEEK